MRNKSLQAAFELIAVLQLYRNAAPDGRTNRLDETVAAASRTLLRCRLLSNWQRGAEVRAGLGHTRRQHESTAAHFRTLSC